MSTVNEQVAPSSAPVTETPDKVATQVPKLTSTKPIVSEAVNQTTQASPTPSSNEDWFIREGVKGEGPRPPFLLEKYGYNAEKQAAAYPELEKMLGASMKAPDEYDWGDYKDKFNLESPHLQDFMNYAKQHRISQDAFKKIVDSFVGYAQANEPSLAEEIHKLGPDGQMKFNTVTTWAQNNLSQKACDVLSDVLCDAGVIEMLDEIRQLQYQMSSQPPAGYHSSAPARYLTKEEVDAEMFANKDRYYNDANYRAEITRKYEQVMGRG